MIGKLVSTTVVNLAVMAPGPAVAEKPRGAVRCADLQWSAQVLAVNPDIALACQGVYEKDGILYAKATIEVVKVVGNTLRFRTRLTDGSLGKRRSVTLDSQWRVNIGGREYRLTDLVEGQQLDIFLPQDRFALSVIGSNDSKTKDIEPAAD